MFKKFLLFASAAAFLASCSSAPETVVEATPEEVVPEVVAMSLPAKVDASTISWVGFNTYAKGRHNGTIAIKGGEFKIEGDQLVGGNFTIDMNTIACVDLTDAKSNGDLVGHLKSDDFFAVGTNPEARFEITSVAASTDSISTHTVSGNLTMRGTTNNITIPANVIVSNGTVSVSVPEFGLDRKKWGVMYGSTGVTGVAKDKLIDDNILLSMEIKG